MKKYLLGAAVGLVSLAATIIPGSAATLDDVMARLDSLQRDNQAIRRDNEAMRKELSALRRQNDTRLTRQAVAPANAPSRASAPAASSAMAAAVPVKGGYVEPPQAFSWSGFYMGVHGGYGWGSSDWTLNGGFITGTANPRSRGFLGGIQGGADHQFGNWVAGIEADLSLIDADATSTDALGGFPGINATAHSQIDWLATFTGRFGYAFDRSLLYVKGGVAGAEFKDHYSYFQSGLGGGLFDLGTQSNTRIGWTAGAGFEYAILNNWTAKIEYNYLDFGSKDETFVVSGAAPTAGFNQSIERKLQLVKLGINYKFGDEGR